MQSCVRSTASLEDQSGQCPHGIQQNPNVLFGSRNSTSSNKKLVVTSASLLVTRALLVVTRRIELELKLLAKRFVTSQCSVRKSELLASWNCGTLKCWRLCWWDTPSRHSHKVRSTFRRPVVAVLSLATSTYTSKIQETRSVLSFLNVSYQCRCFLFFCLNFFPNMSGKTQQCGLSEPLHGVRGVFHPGQGGPGRCQAKLDQIVPDCKAGHLFDHCASVASVHDNWGSAALHVPVDFTKILGLSTRHEHD